jgi:hypothetical protein
MENTMHAQVKEISNHELAIRLQDVEERLAQCEAKIKAIDDGLDRRAKNVAEKVTGLD